MEAYRQVKDISVFSLQRGPCWESITNASVAHACCCRSHYCRAQQLHYKLLGTIPILCSDWICLYCNWHICVIDVNVSVPKKCPTWAHWFLRHSFPAFRLVPSSFVWIPILPLDIIIGVHFLHCCFSMLTWYNDDTSDMSMHIGNSDLTVLIHVTWPHIYACIQSIFL